MKKIILFVVVVCLLQTKNLLSQSAFYNLQNVQTIELFFSASNWDYQLDTAKLGQEEYTYCDSVKINGVLFDSVGVKYKGNSSFDSTFKKNPLHIELNTFKDQNYLGIEDIKLSNMFKDPSMLREVLSYKILSHVMHAPNANFIKVYVNNNYIGLYTNTEHIGNKFIKEHFYTDDQQLVKCNPSSTTSPSFKSNMRKLTPHDSTSYTSLYELKSDKQWTPMLAFIDSINKPFSNLNSIMNVDAALWMLAFNNTFVNLDSYTGVFAQNYYWGRDNNGMYNPIIWDLNMCFASFPFAGAGNTNMNTLNITSMQTMAMYLHSADTYWPLINRMYEDTTYRKMYVAKIKYLKDNFLDSTKLALMADTIHTIINNDVMADTNKFFTDVDYNDALTTALSVGNYSVPGITNLATARNNYFNLQADITATAPSITFADTCSSGIVFGQASTINATILNATNAYMYYRFAKDKPFIKTELYDDGLHNDGGVGDNLFGTSIVIKGSEVQYYIYAQNANAGSFAPSTAAYNFYTLQAKDNLITGIPRLSEACANNTAIAADANGQLEDWIEVSATNSVALGNFYLSDDYTNLKKWAFPTDAVVNMAADAFPIFWADNDIYQKGVHTNFKLNDSNAYIVLSNKNGLAIDTMFWANKLDANQSVLECLGTKVISSATWPVTFNKANCPTSIIEFENKSDFTIYPNPSNGLVNINYAIKNNSTLQIFTMQGTQVASQFLLPTYNSASINLVHLPAGVYFIKLDNTIKKIVLQ
jgi:spore coat protein CotH